LNELATHPLIATTNRKRRLQFARAHQYWTVEDWDLKLKLSPFFYVFIFLLWCSDYSTLT